ncbi:hypothetical protein [Flavobacterium sp.]|uniref:hypothetical protein n=1 Tax=Flavobacterium sp. TaxID=239 RepID=UPI00286F6DF3|nr:hypothetical protein [Flavobacterium sp.]
MPNYDKTQQLPIYKKAILIVKLVDSLTASFPDDNELMFHIKAVMNEDAVLLPSKIAGAEAGKLYSIKMQNAAIIRYHALNLYVQVGGLSMFENLTDQKYIKHIRTEIENFRLLFIDWVSSFDTSNYIWDDWELFNPKGAIPPSI